MVVLNDRTRKARVAEEMRENSKPIHLPNNVYLTHKHTHTTVGQYKGEYAPARRYWLTFCMLRTLGEYATLHDMLYVPVVVYTYMYHDSIIELREEIRE